MTAGRVGRPHGLDGSFRVEAAAHPLPTGTEVVVGGEDRRVERRAGTDREPLVRLEGVSGREAAAALRGELLLVGEEELPLEEGEWLAGDLVGCRVEGIGTVRRVIAGVSCDVLEVGEEGVLVPLVSDAVKRVDVEAREIEVDARFLGLEGAE